MLAHAAFSIIIKRNWHWKWKCWHSVAGNNPIPFFEQRVYKSIVVICKLCAGSSSRFFPLEKKMTSNLSRHLKQRHNVKLMEIHPNQDVPTAAAEDGCSPSMGKRLKLDSNFWRLSKTSNKEPKKLVAPYVMDDTLPIFPPESLFPILTLKILNNAKSYFWQGVVSFKKCITVNSGL